jgi:hypothetical protein
MATDIDVEKNKETEERIKNDLHITLSNSK